MPFTPPLPSNSAQNQAFHSHESYASILVACCFQKVFFCSITLIKKSLSRFEDPHRFWIFVSIFVSFMSLFWTVMAIEELRMRRVGCYSTRKAIFWIFMRGIQTTLLFSRVIVLVLVSLRSLRSLCTVKAVTPCVRSFYALDSQHQHV